MKLNEYNKKKRRFIVNVNIKIKTFKLLPPMLITQLEKEKKKKKEEENVNENKNAKHKNSNIDCELTFIKKPLITILFLFKHKNVK